MSDGPPAEMTLVSPGVFRCPGWGPRQTGDPAIGGRDSYGQATAACDASSDTGAGGSPSDSASDSAGDSAAGTALGAGGSVDTGDDIDVGSHTGAGEADSATDKDSAPEPAADGGLRSDPVVGAQATSHEHPDRGSATKGDGSSEEADKAGRLRDACHGELLDSVRDGLVLEAKAWATRIRQLRELARLSGLADVAGVGQFPQLEMAGSWQVSQLTATRWSDEAERFELCLPQTLQAMEAGTLLVHQAQVLLHRTRHCTEAVALAVEQEVLPIAAALCPSDLRKRVDRAVLKVESDLADEAAQDDPNAVSPAEQRHAEAVAERHVFTRPELDGMATAGALLTAEQVVAWKDGLDLLERRERLADRAAGLDRSAEQRRADLFAALPAMVLVGTALDRAAVCGGASRPASPTPAATISPCPCGRDASDGCCRAAGPAIGVDQASEDAPSPGGAPCDGLHPWTLGPEQIAAQVIVNVHVPMATVLELAREPGTLQGYGPVSAEHVRLLRPQAFRKVFVDGRTGKPLAVDDQTTPVAADPVRRREQLEAMLVPIVLTNADEPQHDPSAHLARLVDLRDAHCCGPGCSSSRTDRDHLQPWPEGPTAERNLGRLSRRCHRAKHHGWTLVRHGDGSSTWTSPLGRTYDRPGPHAPPPRVDLWADPPPPRPAPQAPPPRWAVGRVATDDAPDHASPANTSDTTATTDTSAGSDTPEATEPPF